MIVILAIIALIATPLILNIIEKARKNAFLDSAYGIIDSAKLYYTESLLDGTSGTAKVFFFDEENTELTFGGSKPKGGMVAVTKEGKVSIAIHNDTWCAKKNENESEITLSRYEEGNCIFAENAKDPVITLNGAEEIILKLGETFTDEGVTSKTVDGESLAYTVEIMFHGEIVSSVDTSKVGIYRLTYKVSSNGKIATVIRIVTIENGTSIENIIKDSAEVMRADPDGNPRYVGKDPNNYVQFNHELWRIIGVFDGQIKIIRDSIYQTLIAWDTKGINDWSKSSLNLKLNDTYLKSIEESDLTSYNKIDLEHVWKLGNSTSDTATWTRSNMYHMERGTEVYEGRSTEWIGAIGLMYPSDYGYATGSTNQACENNTMYEWWSSNSDNISCFSSSYNWLFNSSFRKWTMTPFGGNGSHALYASMSGILHSLPVTSTTNATYAFAVQPVLFLKKNVRILDGEGSREKPYTLT